MRRRRTPSRAIAWMACVLTGACAPETYVRDADDEVVDILQVAHDQALGGREDWVVHPEAEQPAPAADEVAPTILDEADGTYDGGAPDAGDHVPPTEHPSDTAPPPGAGAAPPLGADTAPPPGAGAAGFLPDGSGASQSDDAGHAEARVVEIGLAEALEAAFTSGREYTNQQEGLYLAGLSLTGTRYNFGPRIDSTLAYQFDDEEDGQRRFALGGDIGVSQILTTGGTLSAGFGLDTSRMEGPHLDDEDKGRSYSSAFTVALSQPLGRGAGYEVSHEALVQAERNVVYAIRSFEIFRQDHAIEIAEDFFQLVSRSSQIRNNEESYRGAVFDREKAEALRLVDRNTIEDVFRARRREVSEESDLLQAKANYEVAVDAFRIRLGLPDDVRIEIRPEQAPFAAVRIDADSAVSVALRNRLDLMTSRQVLEDTERAVRIARDGLRTAVDLGLGFTLAGAAGDFDNSGPDVWAASAGLTVDLPIQQTPERNIYRSALIAFERDRRDFELLLQNVERDIRDALRQLRRIELQIVLQEQQIEQEIRAVAVTEIRVESGDADNRDLLEARQALVDLQNQLIDQKVDHFIARLSLLRDLGLLFIDDKGMWTP